MSHASRIRHLVLSLWYRLRVSTLRWPWAMKRSLWSIGRQIRHGIPTVVVIALLVLAMGGRWRIAGASPPSPEALLAQRGYSVTAPSASRSPSSAPSSTSSTSSSKASSPSTAKVPAPSTSSTPTVVLGRPWKKSATSLTGKINLNTATEEQLMMLPTVGPAKAERILVWRQKNGGFRRIADIRRVKGFGFKTFKRLEPFLDVQGETTLH